MGNWKRRQYTIFYHFKVVSCFLYIGWKLGNSEEQTWKLQGNMTETNSLKTLALKVLQRNSKGNVEETEREIKGNCQETFTKVACKIWSEILQAHLWVVETDHDMGVLRSQGISEPIYTGDEIRKLKGMDKDSLKEIHKVKEVFDRSKIEEINRHDDR